MDFPIFHLDLLGNRMLVAIIAVMHVLINHGLAVGMMPLIAVMEWYGNKHKNPLWDKLAHKILFVCFLITTTVGAMSGVGIWLSVSLVNPYGIASLIRVFFWGWFVEWLVFITEVVLILAYYLTWKKWTSPEKKKKHIRLGFLLGAFSWITMALIVMILGFMMDPGNWLQDHSMFSAMTNPIYVPQLAFRTPLALTEAGVFAIFLTVLFLDRLDPFRAKVLRILGLWTTGFAFFALLGGVWYWHAVPEWLSGNLDVSLLTLGFTEWYDKFLQIIVITVVTVVAFVQLAIFRSKYIPKLLPLLPLLCVFWLTGHFERVREFIRKPYIISKYMYANGIRVEDYPLLNKEGILAHATYSHPLNEAERETAKRLSPPDVTPAQFNAAVAQLQKGKDVFMISCSRCHTGNGTNSVVGHFTRLLGEGPWDPATLSGFTQGMHAARTFMPAFPGNASELEALGKYIAFLKAHGLPVQGAQEGGVVLNPDDADVKAVKPEVKP